MSKANDRQVGGEHYKAKVQHWDMVAEHDLDYFQGQVTKYVMRWKKKNGLQDLEKARHFLDKYIEVEKAKLQIPTTAVVSANALGLELRELPKYSVVHKTGMDHPFGYDASKELGTPRIG